MSTMPLRAAATRLGCLSDCVICSTDPKGGCDAGLNRAETNGQPCLWFQQGCSPGCKTCTGTNGHTTKPLCSTFMEPTNVNASTRTEDPTDPKSFHYSPWRSPGHAPVADACGLAGGTSVAHQGPGEAVFTPNGVAKQGDKGSEVLPKGPAQEVWKAGTAVEVSWGIRFNRAPRNPLAFAPRRATPAPHTPASSQPRCVPDPCCPSLHSCIHVYCHA